MALNGEKIPITLQLDGRLIDGAVVKPLTFAGFAECITEAQSLREPKTMEGRVRRVRMVRQVTYYTNGAVAPVTASDVLQLPIPSARAITARLDDTEGKAGKIIRPGDGIDTAITYELGTPIALQGKDPIRELEFSAKTYGDIEDVLAATDSFQQTSLLIANIAKPLGSTLTVLPSWAVAQITLADGIMIMRGVLPHFLGLPPEL